MQGQNRRVSDTTRCFVAVKIPKEAMTPLVQLQKSMDADAPEFYRWSSLDDVHLTLYFLGEVEEDVIAQACQRFDLLKWKAFSISLEGLLKFPDDNTPKVLAAGVKGEDQALRSLQLKVHDISFMLTQDMAPKVFSPHVTIGRLRKGKPGYSKTLKRAFAQNRLKSGASFTVESFALYKSERGPEGAKHTVIKEFKCVE